MTMSAEKNHYNGRITCYNRGCFYFLFPMTPRKKHGKNEEAKRKTAPHPTLPRKVGT
jgi:hypothetical protein